MRLKYLYTDIFEKTEIFIQYRLDYFRKNLQTDNTIPFDARNKVIAAK